MHRCHAYCYLLRSRCWVSSHNVLYFPFERESARCVTRPNIGCERDCLLPFLQERESQNYSSTVSYLKNILPRNLRPGLVNVAPD